MQEAADGGPGARPAPPACPGLVDAAQLELLLGDVDETASLDGGAAAALRAEAEGFLEDAVAGACLIAAARGPGAVLETRDVALYVERFRGIRPAGRGAKRWKRPRPRP